MPCNSSRETKARGGHWEIRKERSDVCGERGKEKLERRIRAANAERGREREKERGRVSEREREGGKEEEGEEERKKESWQLLGACGVGPFKARSPDARRRNCPPRVTRALLVPPTPPELPLASPPCVSSPRRRRPPGTFSRRTQTVATASMKSHPPSISPFF